MMVRNPGELNNEDLKELPSSEWTEPQRKCPGCGWFGDNSEDATATFHEMIEECETEEGTTYYHCTACNTNFVDRGQNGESTKSGDLQQLQLH
jgi:hypothetical protein